MSTKQQRQSQQIEAHGRNLAALVGMSDTLPDTAYIALATRVHRLEAKARRLTLAACNEPGGTEALDAAEPGIYASLEKILPFGGAGIPVFINRDPRGYALKIDDDWMRAHPDVRLHRDMGGYGILAPEFTGEE